MFFSSVRRSASPAAFGGILTTTAVALLLALHAWLGVTALIGKGVTADEIAHLTAGYSYWRFDDYRIQPENGNLPQRWGALPLLVLKPRLDPTQSRTNWSLSSQWRISHDFFFTSGNNTDYLLFCARATMVLWSVAGGLLVFFWARRLWGPTGALLALTLFALSPTTLAHGPLVTSDMCAAVVLLLAVGAWWRLTGCVSWRNLALSCLATGLAFVAKFSCVLLLPVFALIVAWRVGRTEPLQWQLRTAVGRGRPVERRGEKLGLLLGLTAVHAVAAWVAIWTFFGWRFSGFAPGLPPGLRYYLPWDVIIPATGFWHHVIPATLQLKLLPEAYVEGFAHMLYQGSARGAFLLGDYRITGWWWFFPYAFLAKSSLSELLATGAVTALAAAKWLRRGARSGCGREWWQKLDQLVPLAAFALVYGMFSIASTLNIGQRHILPLYLVVFIAAGALPRLLHGRAARILPAAIALGAAVESWSIRPHYLAFFNQVVGGPQNGWRLLVDSSLDWGQDLPLVADWVKQHRQPREPVFVAQFGSGNPHYEGIPGRELAVYYTFGRGRSWFELEPGLYCVSATMLQDVYSSVHGDWTLEKEITYRRLLAAVRAEIAAGRLARHIDDFGSGESRPLWEADRLRFARLCTYLRVRRPEAVIGYSYFVFRLSAEEVRIVVEGDLHQLVALMQNASAAH